jgi:lysine N6-hydroxylase
MEDIDVLGVGAGPANLSLAALAKRVPDLRLRCYDAKPHFRWHAGMMLPHAELQVSYLKDLVTLVDPTSDFSFLNYLAVHGQLYRFLVAGREACSRQEFELYYRWAADALGTVAWNRQVREIRVSDGRFEVAFGEGPSIRCTTLVLGSGHKPAIPACAAEHLGPQVIHSSDLLTSNLEFDHKDVLVVGGGQSGAEVVDHLLTDSSLLPASLTWVTSRHGFLPLDDSPFANEWFMPSYVEHFFRLSADRRSQLLAEQQAASDGITESLLRRLYTRMYRLDLFAGDSFACTLEPGWRLTGLQPDQKRFLAEVRMVGGDQTRVHEADLVILCTGYRSEFPGYLAPLRDRLTGADGWLSVAEDYSLNWDGAPGLRIYLQNDARATHGVADPNLSLTSWRSARIINAVCGQEVYRIDHARSAIKWR